MHSSGEEFEPEFIHGFLNLDEREKRKDVYSKVYQISFKFQCSSQMYLRASAAGKVSLLPCYIKFIGSHTMYSLSYASFQKVQFFYGILISSKSLNFGTFLIFMSMNMLVRSRNKLVSFDT